MAILKKVQDGCALFLMREKYSAGLTEGDYSRAAKHKCDYRNGDVVSDKRLAVK